jgi:hypothetical protein
MTRIGNISTTKDAVYQLEFICHENSVGEEIIVELYGTDPVTDIDDIELLYSLDTGSATGRNKGDLIEMDIDFDSVEAGNYYCKIYTAETGVLAKTVAIVQ